jgi:hypothetical protein
MSVKGCKDTNKHEKGNQLIGLGGSSDTYVAFVIAQIYEKTINFPPF